MIELEHARITHKYAAWLNDDYHVCPVRCTMLLLWVFQNCLRLLKKARANHPPDKLQAKRLHNHESKISIFDLSPLQIGFLVCWAWANNRTNNLGYPPSVFNKNSTLNREHDVDNINVEWCLFELLRVAARVRARAPATNGRVDETQRPSNKWEQFNFF